MGLPRAIEGARYTGAQIIWSQDDGTVQNLSGATITGTIEDKDGTSRSITGTLALVTPASGIFSWAYSVADVGTVGRFLVQFKADYGGELYDLSYPEVWVVERAL